MISGLTVGTCYDGEVAESRWGGESGDLAGGGVYVWRQMRVKRRSGLGEAAVVRTYGGSRMFGASTLVGYVLFR
jgi:hypothetical protein